MEALDDTFPVQKGCSSIRNANDFLLVRFSLKVLKLGREKESERNDRIGMRSDYEHVLVLWGVSP